ncbi:hypothetical protein BpHYR1_010551 [Brachionus plicatilis]|uniref:Uncharacterized protein n=1 Tax=Brachionus plicatilis TaxID=10195 RepID=A0A3M7T871_BRAPC|nr:hypothetical protein BpHYR1_010551 [Brachionus plicatilis]
MIKLIKAMILTENCQKKESESASQLICLIEIEKRHRNYFYKTGNDCFRVTIISRIYANIEADKARKYFFIRKNLKIRKLTAIELGKPMLKTQKQHYNFYTATCRNGFIIDIKVTFGLKNKVVLSYRLKIVTNSLILRTTILIILILKFDYFNENFHFGSKFEPNSNENELLLRIFKVDMSKITIDHSRIFQKYFIEFSQVQIVLIDKKISKSYNLCLKGEKFRFFYLILSLDASDSNTLYVMRFFFRNIPLNYLGYLVEEYLILHRRQCKSDLIIVLIVKKAAALKNALKFITSSIKINSSHNLSNFNLLCLTNH